MKTPLPSGVIIGSPDDRLHELCRISELLEAAGEHGEASINGSDNETSPAIVDAAHTPLRPQGPSPPHYHFQSGMYQKGW